MNMRTLYLSWQNPDSRQWFVVGRLSEQDSGYEFVYTRGITAAREEGFQTLPAFPQTDRTYEGRELFAVFQNRLMTPSRVDYADHLEWLNFPARQTTPLVLLERTNGTRQTDSLELFRRPEREADGSLQSTFFLRGLRHRHPTIQAFMEDIEPGSRLFMAPDPQNERDPDAVLLRTEPDIFVPGYLPRYLSTLASELLQIGANAAVVTVEKVNPRPAPVQLRVLCRFSACNVPEDLLLFQNEMFLPLCQ